MLLFSNVTIGPISCQQNYTSHIYYIVREALTNISKHAHATSITVRMFAFEDHLHISIRDDGVGMDKLCTNVHMYNGYQQGLVGIRERVTCIEWSELTIEKLRG